jgi:BirA family biotin operon repressor/biotin-[acetyl-CoA-carboxylase] ligase
MLADSPAIAPAALHQQVLGAIARDRQAQFSLDPEASAPPGNPALRIYGDLPSTNEWLWHLERTAGPLPDGTTVMALRQSAGRGQWGRQWQSPEGGLYLSWFVRPQTPAENAPQLTLCAIWGVAAALRDRGLPVWIKWPNDLLLGDRKLGGILTETRLGSDGRINRAVIGIGLNWQNPTPETGISLAQWFRDNGPIPGLDDLAAIAAIVWLGLWRGYQTWEQQGIGGFLADYLELLAHRGRPLTVGDRTGLIIGVTAQGELRVRFPDDPTADTPFPPGSLSLGYGRPPA